MEAKLQQQVPQKAQANKPNLTGIPTQMKLNFEQRSGLSFDDVRVHYNSDKPAQLQALAYTQGTQVYVGPGQEIYLPHELGHIVQQKAGLVHPTKFINGIAINDSPLLEKAADAMSQLVPVQKKCRDFKDSNVIQCAGTVAVSLSPVALTNFSASEIYIDTITIADRFETGLRYNKKPTQGDHTIADAFVKKYQKEMLKGHTIEDALEFYYKQASEILKETDFILQINPDDKRAQIAEQKADDVIDLTDTYAIKTGSFDQWNVLMKEIIFRYNEAYAHSPFATQGHGTGGHGEKGGLSALKNIRSELRGAKKRWTKMKSGIYTIPTTPQTGLSALFDMESSSIAGAAFTAYKIEVDDIFVDKASAIAKYITATTGKSDGLLKNADAIKEEINKIKKGYKCNPAFYKFVNMVYDILNVKKLLTSDVRIRYDRRKKFKRDINDNF